MARTIFLAAGKAKGLKYTHGFHKTARCCYVPHRPAVEVLHSREHRRAFFGGLTICGSVWSCPVCAAKVQERRRTELAVGIDWIYSVGLQPAMVTLTFPHRAWHSLKVLLRQQSTALSLLRRGEPWQRFLRRFGYEGVIRSLELTHGRNGWHPHTHEVWIVRKDVDAEKLREAVLKRWESACARAGLLDLNDPKQVQAFREHAVDVRGNISTSDYLAKQDDSRHWGADREMAKGSTKQGRAKGLHAFGLLAKARDGDKRAARLFMAQALALRGRPQLFWTHGLKVRAGVIATEAEDTTDEQEAAKQRDEADSLGLLGMDEWRLVRKAKAQSQVLDAAEVGGWPAVEALVERLTLAEIARLEAVLASCVEQPAGAGCASAELADNVGEDEQCHDGDERDCNDRVAQNMSELLGGPKGGSDVLGGGGSGGRRLHDEHSFL